jgi:hypothetical protein
MATWSLRDRSIQQLVNLPETGIAFGQAGGGVEAYLPRGVEAYLPNGVTNQLPRTPPSQIPDQ